MKKPTKHWCPECDQGWVERVTIAPMQQKGWLCSECEAFWPFASAKSIGNKSFVQFGVWAREQGEDVVVVR